MTKPVEIMAAAFAEFNGTGTTQTYIYEAETVLQALRDAGYVIVPREPTEAMINAAYRQCGYSDGHNWSESLKNHYRAMLQAYGGAE